VGGEWDLCVGGGLVGSVCVRGGQRERERGIERELGGLGEWWRLRRIGV
jgi:hypothetical protein